MLLRRISHNHCVFSLSTLLDASLEKIATLSNLISLEATEYFGPESKSSQINNLAATLNTVPHSRAVPLSCSFLPIGRKSQQWEPQWNAGWTQTLIFGRRGQVWEPGRRFKGPTRLAWIPSNCHIAGQSSSVEPSVTQQIASRMLYIAHRENQICCSE